MLSLFSGCGGMDIGFEGNFICLKKSINTTIHSDWIEKDNGEWVVLKPTLFETVFANDIRPDAKSAWVSYFSKRNNNANEIYHIESIVDLVKRARQGEAVFPPDIDIVTGGFPCQDFSIAGKRFPDARFLIGDEGDRLDDLQYMVNRLVQAKWSDAPRIRIDCDSYRARAEAKLLRRARSRAERVLKTGKPLLMEKLNAYQRRLVHNDLATIPGIVTQSEETESRFKRITISRAD